MSRDETTVTGFRRCPAPARAIRMHGHERPEGAACSDEAIRRCWAQRRSGVTFADHDTVAHRPWKARRSVADLGGATAVLERWIGVPDLAGVELCPSPSRLLGVAAPTAAVVTPPATATSSQSRTTSARSTRHEPCEGVIGLGQCGGHR